MNDEAKKGAPDLAVSLALSEAAKHPQSAELAARYLNEQIKTQQEQLKIQREHAEREREQAARETSLHDLHIENLKLQSQALRSQHRQLRAQRLHDRFRTIYQSVLSIIALTVLGVIVYAVYSAATDQSVVVNSFQVPPSFAAAGNSGTVVAGEFLDQLQALQTASRGSQAAKVLEDAWSNNIQLQVPDIHVSLGDIRRTLHQWLGHEIQISGNVVQQGNQITLTVRGSGFAAKTFSGSPANLPKLVTAAAEYVYSQAEPYLFATYLELNNPRL